MLIDNDNILLISNNNAHAHIFRAVNGTREQNVTGRSGRRRMWSVVCSTPPTGRSVSAVPPLQRHPVSISTSYCRTFDQSTPLPGWVLYCSTSGDDRCSIASTAIQLISCRIPLVKHHGDVPWFLPFRSSETPYYFSPGFSLNGELMMDRMGQEIAFKGVDVTQAYVPAISIGTGQQAKINFGQVSRSTTS